MSTRAERAPTAPASYVAPLLLVVMFGGYLALGVLDGGGGVLWPDVIDAFGVSKAQFGLASGIGIAIVFPIMIFAGPIANRVDKRLILTGGFIAMMGAAAIVIGGSGALLMLFLMMLRGLSVALLDLGNNAIAIDYQRDAKRHIMGPLHSMYSLGTLVGAIVVFVLFEAGGNFKTAYAGFAVIFTTMFILSLLTLRNRKRVKGARAAKIPLSITLDLLKRREIVLLGGICGLCIIGEMVVTQWSGIYLRDGRGFGENSRVIAIGIYGTTMFLGRLFNGPIVNALGPKRTLVADGICTAFGGLLMLSGLPQPVVMLGFALVGLGLAGMIPLALSIAGVAAPHQSAAATGAVMFVSYLGLAFGPMLAGAVATLANVRVVMGLEVLAGVLAALFALGVATNSIHFDSLPESHAPDIA